MTVAMNAYRLTNSVKLIQIPIKKKTLSEKKPAPNRLRRSDDDNGNRFNRRIEFWAIGRLEMLRGAG